MICGKLGNHEQKLSKKADFCLECLKMEVINSACFLPNALEKVASLHEGDEVSVKKKKVAGKGSKSEANSLTTSKCMKSKGGSGGCRLTLQHPQELLREEPHQFHLGISVFCYSITNCHKLSVLTWHKCIMSQVPWFRGPTFSLVPTR